jgi:hypothetical protein
MFREIYETQLGSLGRIMRGVEVLGIGMYSIFIIQGLWMCSITHYWIHFKNTKPDKSEHVRKCFSDRNNLFEMAGTTPAFAEIEVLVYFTFLLTIVFYMVRSRFRKSGIDNSEQFEESYMSYLVNMII